jgi:hypothetical protein
MISGQTHFGSLFVTETFVKLQRQRIAGKRRNRGRRNGANGGVWQNEPGCG